MVENIIKLALFDLDGTLYDTENANYLAYKKACTDICDISISESFFHDRCMSKNYKEFLPLAGVPADKIAEIHEHKKNIYPDFFRFIRENTKLFSMAAAMRKTGTLIVIVTTASRKNTLDILKNFKREDFFDMIVTQEMISELKPSPQAYLYAMENFAVTPEECIIFEDSETGIEAACKSGASVFVVKRF